MSFDLVLAGVGGQGVLSIAWVLDHAAHAEGWRVKQSEVHGMAQRGGAVSAFVRLSRQPVASDLIATGTAALVVAVEPLEALRYTTLLRPDGALVTDVTPLVNIDPYPDPAALLQVLFWRPAPGGAGRHAAGAGRRHAQGAEHRGAGRSVAAAAAAAGGARSPAAGLVPGQGRPHRAGQPACVPHRPCGQPVRAGAARRGGAG
jgi:Pyruvate/2-oxoacid:ferredoxin oxidoreductase gamma subunit